MSVVQAWQRCLAAENAAIWGYGVVGGVLAGEAGTSVELSYADASYDAHVNRRDRLNDLLTSAGATPIASRPAYRLPFAVDSLATSRRLARLLESRSADVYAAAVAAADVVDRPMLVDALTDCAIRTVGWGGVPVALPGL